MHMKTLAALIAITSISASAYEIKGTLMLKGSLKSKIVVNTVKTTCKLKIEKVTNILDEDEFGNPGYQARVQISLDGNDWERQIKVKYDKELMVVNMYSVNGKKTVSDNEYRSLDGSIKVMIDDEGRLLETTFPYQNQNIKCVF
jgi:hypothetical protein